MQVAEQALAGVKAQRTEAVVEAITKIKSIEREKGVTREALEEIREVMLPLAARKELFPDADFEPEKDEKGFFPSYLLAQDDDHRFAMYLSVSIGVKDTAPHNHTTWAVIAGVQGVEENRFYERIDDGSDPQRAVLKQIGGETVRPGNGVCLMPEDIHSIHPRNEIPSFHLHMYGLALDQLTGRDFFNLEEGTRKTNPGRNHIRDAR